MPPPGGRLSSRLHNVCLDGDTSCNTTGPVAPSWPRGAPKATTLWPLGRRRTEPKTGAQIVGSVRYSPAVATLPLLGASANSIARENLDPSARATPLSNISTRFVATSNVECCPELACTGSTTNVLRAPPSRHSMAPKSLASEITWSRECSETTMLPRGPIDTQLARRQSY